MLNNEYANFLVYEYVYLCAIFLVSITFIASGIVKLDDPIGFSQKIEEYLHVLASQWGAYLRFFMPYTLFFAIAIATLEIVLGTALLAHWQFYWALRGLFLLTLFFTGLTFYTATFSRITSCGCFGNAWQLTPWQSFFKSVMLLLLLVVLTRFTPQTPTATNAHYWVAAALIASLAFSGYTLRYLSLLRLEPYHIGSRLATLARPRRTLRYSYELEKNGQVIETEDYPKKVEYSLLNMRLLNPEDLPIEAHFKVWKDQQDATLPLLLGLKLLIICQQPDHAPADVSSRLHALLQRLSIDVQPILITPEKKGEQLAAKLGLPLYTATPDLLRTMVHAPVGLLLLQEGKVKGKWHYRSATRVLKYFALQVHQWGKAQTGPNRWLL